MVGEEFPDAEEKTKNKSFAPIKERKNRDSYFKSKSEIRRLPPPIFVYSEGRKGKVSHHSRQAHADVGQNVVQSGKGPLFY